MKSSTFQSMGHLYTAKCPCPSREKRELAVLHELI